MSWVSLGETGHVPFPVTEDMAIAALLHDAVEDEGGLPRLRDIEAKFGNKVAKMVEGCTDSFVEYPDKKVEWDERKSSYIELQRTVKELAQISATENIGTSKSG